MKNTESLFEKAFNLLEKLNLQEFQLKNLADRMAIYCKSFIKQDVDISVEYQPSDGFCLLYSYEDDNNVNIPVRFFLDAVKKNNYEKLDINKVYFL